MKRLYSPAQCLLFALLISFAYAVPTNPSSTSSFPSFPSSYPSSPTPIPLSIPLLPLNYTPPASESITIGLKTGPHGLALVPPPRLHSRFPTEPQTPIRVNPVFISGISFMETSSNTTLVLRGFNVVGDAKLPPFQVIQSKDLDLLTQFGSNVVRLLFNWEALESSRDMYNWSYITYLDGVIQNLEARGIWVILDFHQDGFSRFAFGGCGEGFPKWAVPDVEGIRFEPDNGDKLK